jgi:hypothetical protein
MVYAFGLGLFLGLPLGCYLREVGYANKIRSAYEVFVPPPTADKSDRFRNKAGDFYKNLQKGQADVKDFERYVYGGSHNERSKDATDIAE